ncbi:alpha/beta hydrolase [Vibrio sp. HN007]|uniref:alpha/beta hydrolase n=1 Tax=Vibrio iocasae TaxID=3098914 RepID=UPI0035D4183E
MKPKLTTTLAVVLLFISNLAMAIERDISFFVDDQKVVGTLNLPDDVINPDIVLIFHGFSGNRHELLINGVNEHFYDRLARSLANKGFASLRIDFRDSGDSYGEWANTTFSKQIEDGNAAVEWILNQPGLKKSNISLIGWSQGGLVASHVAQDNPQVKAVALWAPVTHPYLTYSRLLGDELVLDAALSEEDKLFEATLPWGTKTQLRTGFFNEILTINPIAAISDYKGPLLVIRGTKDELILSADSWVKYHKGSNALIELDTDHSWSLFEGPDVIDNQLLPKTIGWLKANQ